MILILVALGAGSGAVVAWRRARRPGGAAVLGGLAGALALAAWALAGGATSQPARAPDDWLVESALAFNQRGSPAMQGAGLASRHVREGQRLKVQRRFGEAEQAFRKAVEADPSDADSWADLADCAAAAAGRDLAAGREAIRQALRIDPRHRKALWLRASLELQERKYAAAAGTWRTLEALVAAGSPDARVIAANIAEAEALAAGARDSG